MGAESTLVAAVRSGGPVSRLVRSSAFAWMLSVALHGALFLVFYQLGFGKAASVRRLIIPEARLAVGPAPVLPRPDAPVKFASEDPGAAARAATRTPRLDELPIVSVESRGPGAAGVVVSGPPLLALPGVDAAGTGTALGSAGAGGGPAAFGPVSRFFGQAGNAYKVVYVVDVSASLMYYTDDIIREMQDSIRDLLPTQEFHMVLAMPREIREFEPRRLVPANARYKGMAYDFMRVIAGVPKPGKADPIEAMRRAFAARPELIYFLTDGDYPDVESDLESTLKELNRAGDVKITVIGFDPSPAPRALLERIARTNGGHCRFVEPK
ncbi:MAG: hypothetical protein HY718_16930 [Planctomycetes bacterium]|nr:hypothetical protein [Planctomycetota bacterium]